ncbi:MAG: ferredoxin [Candidatus Margulisbacteria bacterium]|nr:ferredoxin [Candidatus Margulisiibacteriota bacterium]
MSIKIDQALCSGCGVCIELCPEVFAWDSDGRAIVLKQESETCNIEEISDQCPTEAINL